MRFPPLFLVPDYGLGDRPESPAPGSGPDDTAAVDTADGIGPSSGPDYRHYTDEQLLAEREWRLRTLAEPARIEGRPVGGGPTAGDDRVDRITDELIRRARLRHPSARGRAV